MIGLQTLLPSLSESLEAERAVQEFLRIFLVRTNFVPGYRYALGWRGLKQTPGPYDSWTACIKGKAGVFGMAFDGADENSGWKAGFFSLCYFPAPDEEAIEHVSLAAAEFAHRPDYFDAVRDLGAHPDLVGLFGIGRLHLAVHPESNAVLLGLAASTRDRIIAEDGIEAVLNDELVVLVSPGGADRDFPCFEAAYTFFEVLAASVSFCLKEAPNLLREIERPAQERGYDRGGRIWQRPASDSFHRELWLGYGVGTAARAAPIFPLAPPAQTERHFENLDEKSAVPFPEARWWRSHQPNPTTALDKQALGIDERPSLIVLTGFLGSGKTSFLRNFIEHQVQMNRFVAVIQNEIGAVGLDGKLLEGDVAVTEVDEGCVCCSLIGNLKAAVGRILSEFQPDIIVLETTGLANPLNLIDELTEIAERVRFDSVTTVVDAARIEQDLSAQAVAEAQVRAADILLLNKVDLVSESDLVSVRKRIAHLNPRATVLTATHGDIPPGLLYGVDPLEEAPIQGHMLSASFSERKNSHATHLEDRIESVKIDLNGPLDRDRFLRQAVDRLPPGVLRAKGIVDFSDAGQPEVFQYVGGRWELSAFSNAAFSGRFLIFIGRDLDSRELENLVRKVVISVPVSPVTSPSAIH